MRRAGAVTALVTALLAALVVSATPAAATDSPDRCDSRMGTTLPVILVHGWNSSRHAWDKAVWALGRYGDTTPYQFDYEDEHDQWVTDPHIGPALNQLIACLARNSAAQGGPGKVVLVGHSEGGLAIRCALETSCSHGLAVQQYVAEVITVGTPTQGSFLRAGGMYVGDGLRMAFDGLCEAVLARPRLPTDTPCKSYLTNAAARAFAVNSTELKALRSETPKVPVYAIAGDIKLDVAVLFGHYTIAHGDGVVDVRSQQAWNTATATVDCGRMVIGVSLTDLKYAGSPDHFTNYKCWHGSETNNDAIISNIVGSVEAVYKDFNPSTQSPLITPTTPTATATAMPSASTSAAPPSVATELGAAFDARCTEAWPTAPTKTSDGIVMLMQCAGVPTNEFTFVQVTYPNTSFSLYPDEYVHVNGEVAGEGQNDAGYTVLLVNASSVTPN